MSSARGAQEGLERMRGATVVRRVLKILAEKGHWGDCELVFLVHLGRVDGGGEEGGRVAYAVVEVDLDGVRRRRDGLVVGDGLAEGHAVGRELGRNGHRGERGDRLLETRGRSDVGSAERKQSWA